MAELTVTRAQLRRAIAKRLRMDFARRIGDSRLVTTASGSTTGIIDATYLVQPNDHWNGAWVFIADTGSGGSASNVGQVRRINDSDQATGKVILLEPLPVPLVTNDVYEIHSHFTAPEIHEAIDAAISDGRQAFPGVSEDVTKMILREELDITLPTSPRVYAVLSVWLEQVDDVLRGTATGGSTTTLVDSGLALDTNDHQNKTIAIHDGTGEGQYAVIQSNTATTFTITAWLGGTTDAPDTTSKYVVKDTTREYRDWRRITSARFDQDTYPTTMHLTNRYTRWEGMSLRIVYAYHSDALTSESDTTILPQEFVVRYALHHLYSNAIGSNKVEREKNAFLARHWKDEAEAYKRSHMFHLPAGTLWTEVDRHSGNLPSDYPFADQIYN